MKQHQHRKQAADMTDDAMLQLIAMLSFSLPGMDGHTVSQVSAELDLERITVPPEL